MNAFNLGSLISTPKCFQPTNLTSVDLILTNQTDLFKKRKRLGS